MSFNRSKGYIYVIASAIIYGCMPLGAKIIYADGVTPFTLVLLRNLLSLPILALLVILGGESLAIKPKRLLKVSGISIFGSCITPVLLYVSYQHIPSGNATVFHFVYPAAVVLAELLIFREKVDRRSLLCVVLCTVGVIMSCEIGGNMSAPGVILALASGITYATYITLLSRSDLDDISGFKFVFYTAATCSAVMLIVSSLTGQLKLPSNIKVWGTAFLFSVALCVGAVSLFWRGTRLIGGSRSSILSAFEPTVSVIIAIFFLKDQKATVFNITGSLLVILSTVLIALFDMKKAENGK